MRVVPYSEFHFCRNFDLSLMMRRMAPKQKKPNYWIFQSNPKMYDLLEDLKTGDPDPYWSANQHRDEMSVGDKIFFRISGTKKGIYATGTIRSLPVLAASQFGDWQVGVTFDGLIDPPLLRSETAKIKSLKNFRPLVGAEATNFRVPTSIGETIDRLIKRDGRVVRNIDKGVEILPKLKKVRYKMPEADKSERRKKSQAHIRAVEQAGVSAAMKYFFKLGLSMEEDCQQKGVGYDFIIANKKQRMHVEVKGVSSSKIDFNLTPKELLCAKSDPKWHLVVVLNALAKADVKIFTGNELLAKASSIQPTQYRVILK